MLPPAPVIHDMIRQRFRSHLWWVLFGFESEPGVGKIFAEIEEVITSPAEVERVVCPVIRAGEQTGTCDDKFLMLFAKKTAVDIVTILAKCSKHGAVPMKDEMGARDCLPLSRGYTVTLFNIFDQLIRSTHRDN